jgi:hypothetical protein
MDPAWGSEGMHALYHDRARPSDELESEILRGEVRDGV